MRRGSLLPAFAAVVALAACGDPTPEQPSPGPGGDVVTIRGNERLGWDQQAASSTELSTLRFAIYVDGARSELPDVTCETAVTAAGFPCSGRLPSMSPGLHTLELAAFVIEGSGVIESPRSAPFRVNVSPGVAAPVDRAAGATSRSTSGAPAIPDLFEPLVPPATFSDITSVGVTPDGWLLIAERTGLLHAIPPDTGGRASSLAVAGTRIEGAAGSLVDLAVDPDFVRSRMIYVLQTAPSRDGLAWQLARYRQAGDAFGERAVLLETGEAGAEPAGIVRVGPDGRLFVAIEEENGGIRRRRAARETTVLRLNPDGTTPADQPSGSPLYAAARGAARGLDWNPVSGTPWLALDSPPRGTRLIALPSDARRARAGPFDVESFLPGSARVTGMAFYRGDRIPALRGSLLVAAEDGLHRAILDESGAVTSLEPLAGTPVRALTITADGRLIVASADAVYRLREQ